MILNGSARFLLLLFAIFGLVQGNSFASTSKGPKLDETRTQYALRIVPPVIDGEIIASEWRFAGGNNDYWQVFPDADTGFADDGIRGGVLGGGTRPADPDDLSFKIYAGFDTTYLYVAVRVRDNAIQSDSALADSANSTTWEDDSVEVFIDGGNANHPTWASGQIGGQFAISANNAYREAEAGNPGYGPAAAWHAKTTLLADGSGYDAEFRISLATLGNPKPGDVLGFTVAVNDDDDGGTRERQVLWVGTAHQPVTYGNLVLGPQSYSAIKVTTPPNPDGKINLNEYSGADEIRVNARLGVVYVPGGDDNLPSTDLEYKAYIVHDNEAVHIAVDVTDEAVRTTNSDVEQQPDLRTWEDDSVELFFDLNNSKNSSGGTELGNGIFEGQYTQTYKGFYYDGAPSKEAQKGVHWFGTGSLTPTGYQVEFKILKSSLGNPTNNVPFGFNIGVNDDDELPDYSHIGWTGQGHREYTYGALTLIDSSTPVTPLRIVEAKPELAAGGITLRWEGGVGPLFQMQKSASINGPFEPVSLPQPHRTYTDLSAPKTAAQSFYRVQQGSDGFSIPTCITTPALNSWVNTPFADQTGIFTATYNVTPSQGAPLDCVIALSSGSKIAFTDFACLVRLSTTGKIDARNGNAYAAVNDISYAANVKYTFRVVVNVPARTYSVYVTPEGGTEQTVGIDYAFRPTAGAVTNLNNWGAIVANAGSATICNFAVAQECVTTTAIETWVNTPFNKQTGVFTATFNATPSADLMDSVMAFSAGPKAVYSDFACLVRFNNAGMIDSRNGGAYEAANDISYSANVKHSFRLVVNVPARTYSVYVTPEGGTEQTVGVDFAFRPTAGAVTNLDHFGVVTARTGAEGSNTVCNFKLQP